MNIQVTNGAISPITSFVKGHIYRFSSQSRLFIATTIDGEEVLIELTTGQSFRSQSFSSYSDVTHLVSLQDIKK